MTSNTTPSPEEVERVARAMFDCYRGYDAETQQRLWEQARYGLMRQAEKAIAAMPNPVDALRPWLRHSASCLGQQDINLDETCRCGLDEALARISKEQNAGHNSNERKG